MRNIFQVFGGQNTAASEQVDLNEQDLKLVNGAHGDDYCHEEDDDYCYREYDYCDEEYSYEHHRHHRHHN